MRLNPDIFSWQSAETAGRYIDQPWREWVLDVGSLTERLKRTFSNDFLVKVIRHDEDRISRQEQLFLGLDSSHATVREVALVCAGKPVVYARSVLPVGSLAERNGALASLGSRPLGEYLFSHPAMQRGPFEVMALHAAQLDKFVDQGSTAETVWGRRSLFYLHDQPLSVTEFFLPALFALPSTAVALCTDRLPS